MKLRTGFLFFNYLLTAMALYCLTLSQVFSSLLGLFLFAGLGACLVLEVKKIIPLKPPLQILSSSWCLIFIPLLYFSFDLVLMDLLVWVLAILLFSRLVFKTELNDTVFGYLISLTCLLLGTLITQSLAFAILFLAFYLVLAWGLMTYSMMSEQTGSNSPPALFKQSGENAFLGGRLFGFSAALMILGLVLTTLIFTGFPRLGQGLSLSGPSSSMTGFSESVRLGDVGRIKQNSQVVMRIEFERNGKPYRPQGPVYWRGVVLDHFNGSSWFSTAKPKWKFSNQPGTGVQLFPFDPKADTVRQQIYMDEFDSNIIFSQGLPLFVDGNFQSLQVNNSFSLKTMNWQNRSRRVTLISGASPSLNNHAGWAFNGNNQPLLKKFLQLPTLSPQITRLAGNLTANAVTQESKANNILGHLRSEFGYTLEQAEISEQTPLDHFLFTRKKGHCEYFASSMVMLLRLSGVPARLVNGFMGLEWNELGQYMVVRQHHAHSWVEAYLPEKGWVIYDPTPADPMFALNRFGDPINRALDLMRLNWQRYVLSYSFMDQARLFYHLQSTGEETLDAIKGLGTLEVGVIKTFIIDNLGVLVGLFGLALILALKKKKLLRWKFFLSAKPPVYPVWLYREMLKKLNAQGIQKHPSWTPREFIKRLSTLPDAKLEPVQKITACYEKSRFGQFAISETEKKELLNHLKKI
jgi:hypothetical protein